MAKNIYNDDLLLEMDKILTPEQDDVGFLGGLWDSIKGVFSRIEAPKIDAVTTPDIESTISIAEPEPVDDWQQLYDGIEKQQEPLVWKAKKDPLVKRIWDYLNPLDLFKYDKPHYEPTDEMKAMSNMELFAGLKDNVISDINSFMKYEQELRNRNISPMQYMEAGAAIATFSIMGAYGIAGLNTLIQSSPTIKKGAEKFIGALNRVGLLKGAEYAYQAKQAGLGLMYAGYPLTLRIVNPIAGIETVGELQLALQQIIPQYPAIIEKLIDSSMKGLVGSHEILSATQEIPEKEVKQQFSAVNALKKLFGVKAEKISKEEQIALEQMRPKKEEPLTEKDLDTIIEGREPEITPTIEEEARKYIRTFLNVPGGPEEKVRAKVAQEQYNLTSERYAELIKEEKRGVPEIAPKASLVDTLRRAPTKQNEGMVEDFLNKYQEDIIADKYKSGAELSKAVYEAEKNEYWSVLKYTLGSEDFVKDPLEPSKIVPSKIEAEKTFQRALDTIKSAQEIAPKADRVEGFAAIEQEIEKDYPELAGKVPPKVPPIPPRVPPSDVPITPGEPEPDPIDKLNELIRAAKPMRGEIERAYTEERGKRIAQVDKFISDTIDNVGGEEGYKAIIGKLKGELISPEAKPTFEPVKDKLTEDDIKSLYLKTWKHPYLTNWEKITSATGLTDLFTGKIPPPSTLVLMEEVYGSELIKNILSKRLWGQKVTDFLTEVANIPRVMLATADMSAPLRQGIIMMAAHPVLWGKSFGKMFQFAFQPKVFREYFDKDLREHKHYDLMRKSKLAITDPRKPMGEREEAFISRMLQKVPGLKIPVEFAERAYTGFLTKLRVDCFSVWTDELLARGLSPVKDKKVFDAAANVVNTFTGRGSLGKNLNKIGPQLNVLLFSPRLISARFNSLNPVWYATQPKEIRMKVLGDFAKFVIAGTTTLALIKLATADRDDVDIETDPRSADFGKIRIGNTRFDIWGGHQQFARAFTQILMGERKSTVTGRVMSLNKDEYPFTTRQDIFYRFIEGKLAPGPALLKEFMAGAKTFEGEDITVESVLWNKFVPMVIQDIVDAYKDDGLGMATPAGTGAFFGLGVQTYGKKKPTQPTVDFGGLVKDIFK